MLISIAEARGAVGYETSYKISEEITERLRQRWSKDELYIEISMTPLLESHRGA